MYRGYPRASRFPRYTMVHNDCPKLDNRCHLREHMVSDSTRRRHQCTKYTTDIQLAHGDHDIGLVVLSNLHAFGEYPHPKDTIHPLLALRTLFECVIEFWDERELLCLLCV